MKLAVHAQKLIGLAVFVAIAATAFALRDRWLPAIEGHYFASDVSDSGEEEVVGGEEEEEQAQVLELSKQARDNMDLATRPVEVRNHWRKIQIPAEINDRPGVSDRGVTSPAVGVVSQVHAFPGDTVGPGEPLFTLQIFSEYLQNTQSELFQATEEIALVQAEIERLNDAAATGAISGSRIIELNQQLARQQTLIQTYRQDLLTRGLLPEQVDDVADGTFVATIEVVAPPVQTVAEISGVVEPEDVVQTDDQGEGLVEVTAQDELPFTFELQELSVELGQQVQAGQLLCKLSNHSSLYIVGHSFKQEAPYLELAAQEGRAIEIEFAEDDSEHWPAHGQTFQIRHLSNSIDTDSRTFDFFIPLENQSRGYESGDETFVVWRFRPGQRARLHIPVEEFTDVIVLPAEAVVQEGPESFVFRRLEILEDSTLFERRAVHVVHQDRRFAVIANDGSLDRSDSIAQSGAASLNRVLKAQTASGDQPALHVHPDGTVHAAH